MVRRPRMRCASERKAEPVAFRVEREAETLTGHGEQRQVGERIRQARCPSRKQVAVAVAHEYPPRLPALVVQVDEHAEVGLQRYVPKQADTWATNTTRSLATPRSEDVAGELSFRLLIRALGGQRRPRH